MKYRPHRGFLADAMTECVEVDGMAGLLLHLRRQPDTQHGVITVVPYDDRPDDRIGWAATHMVLFNGSPLGFVDELPRVHHERGCTVSEEITPALTPEQWKELEPTVHLSGTEPWGALDLGTHGFFVDEGKRLSLGSSPDEDTSLTPENRHIIAAVCLYGERFGFTQEDVNMLRDPHPDAEYFAQLARFAAKIAALLPPA